MKKPAFDKFFKIYKYIFKIKIVIKNIRYNYFRIRNVNQSNKCKNKTVTKFIPTKTNKVKKSRRNILFDNGSSSHIFIFVISYKSVVDRVTS